MNLQYRPVRREERGMFILLLLIDVADVSLRRQASMTQLRNSRIFAQSDVICLIIWLKADVAGCCSAGSVLR